MVVWSKSRVDKEQNLGDFRSITTGGIGTDRIAHICMSR